MVCVLFLFFFFFNDTATTEIYTLSLHDALPISGGLYRGQHPAGARTARSTGVISRRPSRVLVRRPGRGSADRKSTRLNSSHANISYAVFCLKKKKHKCKTGPITPLLDFHSTGVR